MGPVNPDDKYTRLPLKSRINEELPALWRLSEVHTKFRVKPEDKSQRVTLSLGADTAHVEHQVSGRGHGRWGGLNAAAKEQLKYTQLLFPK